jgi:hypothetical protein
MEWDDVSDWSEDGDPGDDFEWELDLHEDLGPEPSQGQGVGGSYC